MKDHLKALAVFARTVEYGSFRKAAEAMHLSPSVISHHISQLEQQLGVALLYRSTRKLSLTRDGEKLIGPAQSMLKSAEDGLNAVLKSVGELSGELQVTAPALLTQSHLADNIADFLIQNPNVRLKLDYSETPRDIIADGIDVAIRAGWLQDSQLKARKLYTEERVLLASSKYLSDRRKPAHPNDLAEWDWLDLTPVPLRPVFKGKSGEKVSLKPPFRASANNASALYNLSLKGAGLAILPRFMAEKDIQDGEMQVVLPDWKLRSLGIYAVRPFNSPRHSLAGEFVKAIGRK